MILNHPINMKKKFFLIFIFFLHLIFVSYHFQSPKNQVIAFGTIKQDNERISGVSLKVLHNNKVIENRVTGRFGAYRFSLQFNTEYTIVISKNGYLKETIRIDTHVPEEVIAYGANIFWEPDFLIYKIMPGLTIEEFKVPLAHYIFDMEYWGFLEDKDYKLKILPYVSSIIAKIDTLGKLAYETEMLKADSLYNAQKFEEAIMAYYEARKYSSDDDYINQQIKNSKKLIKKQYNETDSYMKAIRKADDFFNCGQLETANRYYQKALIYKPKEEYPLEKIFEIDSLQSIAWILKNELSDRYIFKGDSLFKSGYFNESQENYSEALTILPEKLHPKMMIRTIDSILKLQPIINAKLAATKIPETQEIPTEPSDTLTEETIHSEDTIIFGETSDQYGNIHAIIQSTQESDIDYEAFISSAESGSSSYRYETDNTVSAIDTSETEVVIMNLEQSLQERIIAGDRYGTSQVLSAIGKVYQNDYKLGKALELYNRSLVIKRELHDKQGEAEVLYDIASVLYDSGSYNTAIQTFEQILELSDEINDPAQNAEIFSGLGVVFETTYRYQEAIDNYNRSQEIKNKLGDKEGSSEIYKKIGNIYFEQNNYEMAIEELEKSYIIDEQLDNKEEMASGLNSIGAVYYSMNQYDRALKYFQKSLNIIHEIDNLQLEAITLNNMGNVNFDNNRFNEAIEYYEKSLRIKTDLSLIEGMAVTLHNIGNSFFAIQEYSKALEYYNSSQQAAEKSNYRLVIWKNLEAFAKTFAAMGKYKEAFEKYREYTESRYEFSDRARQLIEMREHYESEKMTVKTLKRELQKQNRMARYEAERNRREMQIIQLEMENKEQQLKKNRTMISCIVLGSFLILIFSLIITRQYRLAHKAYNLVAEQKKHITEGISYAARIQKAVLPPEKITQNLLPEYFILNKPREAVGGDFYWVATHYNKTVVAVSDCTGHGVPGGFMSMLGIAILNEIISIEQPLESCEILTHLRDRVVEALHQKHGLSDSMDGMDISLIIIDMDKNELQFSAAYHSLYLVRDGNLEKIKGDRVSIGYHHLTKPFTSKTIPLQKKDMVYLTTDGFIDQIGQKSKNRFMFSNFKNVLLSIYKKPLREQEAHLEKVLSEWKGDTVQTDDILVMGLRF